MKQTTRKKLLVLLLTLCFSMLFGAFMLNNNFSTTSAAADTTTSSAEDSLTFNLFSNGTAYKVTARNKLVTEVIIPAKYNGLPVTEIADNGFTNCTNLKKVWIPYTVTRIGNNAFANCRNLEIINGMPKVEFIGNNAFAMCTKLDNLILPNTINNLGSTILRNNPNKVYSRLGESQMAALNANWKSSSTMVVVYGNELVLNDVYNDDGTIEGYSIYMQQNLNTEVDFVLGDTYNGLPLLEIEQYAFYFSAFNSFTLSHGEIIPDADSSSELIAETYSDQCEHTVNIASGAFFGMTANYIDILVDVTFEDSAVNDDSYFDYENGRSVEVFSNSTVRSITLPNNISYIPKSAFTDCESLREIKNIDPNVDVNRISANINTIGSEAFSGCQSLINLYIPTSIMTMGNAVFSKWGNTDVKQTLHFDNLYEAPVGIEGYNWDQDWLGTQYENVKLQFKTVKVTFDKEGGEAGTDSVDAMYHQDMPETIAPEKEYFSFEGYFSERNGNGTQYYDRNMVGVTPWDKKNDSVLYAYWIGLPYTVTLNKNGGDGGSDEVMAHYMSPMPEATSPNKTGYKFDGYFYKESDGSTTKYYNEDMTSANNWDKTHDATLEAKYTNDKFKVILKHENTLDFIFATFDIDLPAATKPSKLGWTFHGYFTEDNGKGTMYYDNNMKSVRKWDIAQNNITLYAHMTENDHTLTFDKQGGTGGTVSIGNLHYDQNPLPTATAPNRKGYEFLGYFDAPFEEGNDVYCKYYNADMTPAYYYNVDDNLTIYAHWKINEYKINYVNFPSGFNNANPNSYTISDTPIEFKSFIQRGYKINFTPQSIPANSIGYIEVSCQIEVITYHITYDLNGGSSKGDNPDTYTVESQVILNEANHSDLYFNYWTLNGIPVKNLNGLYRDITLRANWTDTRTINVNEPFDELIITDEKVNLVFNIGFSSDCLIYSTFHTEYLHINGKGRAFNMKIIIDTLNDTTLLLESISINAHSAGCAIETLGKGTLNLFTYGIVQIKGYSPTKSNGKAAIYCGKLVIHTANKLIIKGGDGADGKDSNDYGGNGGNGAPAIITSDDIYILCSNVQIAAGLAGKGGSGRYFGYGGKGASPISGVNEKPTVYILEGVSNIIFVLTENAENGQGATPPPTEIIVPPIDIPVINPGIGGGGGIIIPQPPYTPPVYM